MRADGTPLISGFSLSLWPDLQLEIIQRAIGTDAEVPVVHASTNKRADVLAYGMTVMVSAQTLHRSLSESDYCKDRRWFNVSQSFPAS